MVAAPFAFFFAVADKNYVIVVFVDMVYAGGHNVTENEEGEEED